MRKWQIILGILVYNFLVQIPIYAQCAKAEFQCYTADEFPFYDKNLNKQKIKDLIIHFWPDRKNIISISIYKSACEADWLVKYNHNIPLCKLTNRKISYIYRKDNISYKVDNLVFYRDYLGGDQYGSIYTGFSEEVIIREVGK